MTYNEFIQNIIDTRGHFGISEGYKERHHILPRCMKGTDDESNLIDLYAKEHFIAHQLLAEEFPNNYGLVKAFHTMCVFKRDDQERYICDAEEYQRAKELLHSVGFSDEHRANISKAKMNHEVTDEARQKMSDNHYDCSGSNNPHFGVHTNYDSSGNAGMHWYTDGITNMQCFDGEQPPTFFRGVTTDYICTDETKQKLSSSISEARKAQGETHWYNNGVEQKYLSECPEGWQPGMLPFKHNGQSKYKDCHWYNNGIKNIRAKEGEQPEGFVRGKLKKAS